MYYKHSHWAQKGKKSYDKSKMHKMYILMIDGLYAAKRAFKCQHISFVAVCSDFTAHWSKFKFKFEHIPHFPNHYSLAFQ